MQQELQEAVTAIHRAADSMERHVEVVETLATSVPALTDSVNALVKELNGLLAVVAPVAGAERDVSRVEHFFHRRRESAPEPPPRP
jgi:ABC-type transporter Mla subunit MlaD